MVRHFSVTTRPTTTMSAASGVLTTSTTVADTTTRRTIIAATASVPTRRTATAEIAMIEVDVTIDLRLMDATDVPMCILIVLAVEAVPTSPTVAEHTTSFPVTRQGTFPIVLALVLVA